MKGALITLAIIVGFPLLFIVNRGCKTSAQIINKTFDGDNVINQYEWFKQQWEDYQAIEVKIKTAEDQITTFKEDAGPRKEWTFEDKQEYARLASINSGLQYQKEDMKSKYNARSKMVNRKIFKEGVPSEIR